MSIVLKKRFCSLEQCPIGRILLFVLAQRVNRKLFIMIIARFGIAQASLALLYLNAIIQGCVRFTWKIYVAPTKIPELVVPPQTAVIF